MEAGGDARGRRELYGYDSGRLHATEFPLEYYFDLAGKSGATRLEPAFNETLSNQPYYTVMREGRVRGPKQVSGREVPQNEGDYAS